MAFRPERSKRPASGQPAAPWALLWLGAFAAATWAPLFLVERLAQPNLTPDDAAPVAASIPVPPLPPVGPLPSRPPLQGVEALRQPKAWAALPPSGTTAEIARITPPAATTPISGSLLLGGPLGLESLRETPMVPAARLEQALRDRAANRLEAVPPQWRPAMQALLNGPERVLPAEVVRLPAPHLKAPEEYPLVVKADGIAETSVTPPPRSKETMERWAQKLKASPSGSARPILVVLEPLQADDQSSEHQPVTSVVEPETPQAIQ